MKSPEDNGSHLQCTQYHLEGWFWNPGAPLALPLLLNSWEQNERRAEEPDRACLASLPKYFGLGMATGAMGSNDTTSWSPV